jgi:hypothetical protein
MARKIIEHCKQRIMDNFCRSLEEQKANTKQIMMARLTRYWMRMRTLSGITLDAIYETL